MRKTKFYWDSSCFISYLSSSNSGEAARAGICEDILNHAKNGDVEIWTSVWTIVETTRPKSPTSNSFPLPEWAELLHPSASAEFERIWQYYKRNTAPARVLSDEIT